MWGGVRPTHRIFLKSLCLSIWPKPSTHFKSLYVNYRRRSRTQDEEFSKVKSSLEQVSWVAVRGSEFPVIGVYLRVRAQADEDLGKTSRHSRLSGFLVMVSVGHFWYYLSLPVIWNQFPLSSLTYQCLRKRRI